MPKMNVDTIRNIIMEADFQPRPKRGLLFEPGEAARIRKLAAARKGMFEEIGRECRELMQQSPEAIEQYTAVAHSFDAVTVATGYFLLQKPEFADWARHRVKALLALDSWMYPPHIPIVRHTDHCMTNIGAALARVHELLGDACPEDETRATAERLRVLLVHPYLESVRTRLDWWAHKDHDSNWKIMCHSETGLAVCEFAEYLPEAREVLAHATLGTLELLDLVPPEGDWREGVGYWMATLYQGCRYATALRQLTGGQLNIFDHPAMKATGDFAMMLTTPGSRWFDFNDNKDTPVTMQREGLAVLAKELKREDWMYIARLFPANTAAYIAWAGTDMPARTPERTTAIFKTTGVATLRSGWGTNDTFVGVKCGQSIAPHSHLDAGSFVIESRGRWLVRDESYWHYAHSIGFFDTAEHRWNWDGLNTIGHNTLLIDGKGQTWGEEYPGSIESLESGPGWDRVVADASKTYPGLLTKFVRTVLYLKPDTVVIRDVVECDGDRNAEWLLHHAGTVRSEGLVSVIENDGVSLTVVPFLPDRQFGWRVSDVHRASTYRTDTLRRDVTEDIRYRSFAPFRKAGQFEFLFGLRVNGKPDGSDWEFKTAKDGWTLKASDAPLSVHPTGDSLEAS
jgi:hypothetical protein